MIERSEVCTLVPAAGRGSRLGGNCPKVFTPITDTETIWSILSSKLRLISDHHCLILNSKSYSEYKDTLDPKLNIALQDNPIGMGDAIFKGVKYFSKHKLLVIVWGDQVHVSQNTLKSVVQNYSGEPNQIVLPLVSQEDPYVEYIFKGDKLVNIKQQREGDSTEKGGLSDIGVFALTTNGLEKCWSEFLKNCEKGTETGEINFLPFLIFLSQKCSWKVNKLVVNDPDEARGINTPEDLRYFREMYNEVNE